jgi:predicted glycosyltransferase
MPQLTGQREEDMPPRYILVMAGGGGDGASLMRAAIGARAVDPKRSLPFVMVLGPFMSSEERGRVRQLAAGDPDIHILDFVNQPEALISGATAVVGMAGYNTFCEILSFDKPAMLVPRMLPRREQLIRATRAAEIGLVDALLPDEAENAELMCARLMRLPDRPRPMEAGAGNMLGGLERICSEVMGFSAAKDRLGIFTAPAAE